MGNITKNSELKSSCLKKFNNKRCVFMIKKAETVSVLRGMTLKSQMAVKRYLTLKTFIKDKYHFLKCFLGPV